MRLQRVMDGFFEAKRVAGLSPNTTRNYTLNLGRFYEFLAGELGPNPEIEEVTAQHVRAFLDDLMTSRIEQPGVAYRAPKRLSAKTIKNVHTALSSLWSWAVREGHASEHVVRDVEVARPPRATIEPYTEVEIRRLLDSLSHSLAWRTTPGTQTERPRLRQLRDRAMILFLLDTGVRSSELCDLRIGDVDMRKGAAIVRGKGRMDTGKGKTRAIRFCTQTGQAIQRYLLERNALHRHSERLFTTREGGPLYYKYVVQHLHRLGERADVPHCHAHRFRHTFAINYLRNGGDVYTLQELLGHTSMEMVKRYLKLAQADIDAAHRRASPVANWRL